MLEVSDVLRAPPEKSLAAQSIDRAPACTPTSRAPSPHHRSTDGLLGTVITEIAAIKLLLAEVSTVMRELSKTIRSQPSTTMQKILEVEADQLPERPHLSHDRVSIIAPLAPMRNGARIPALFSLVRETRPAVDRTGGRRQHKHQHTTHERISPSSPRSLIKSEISH
ncbi:hypothetical protein PV326_008655 [Microctonus aethiopoides]|nr:hypothetical protein PV326_008655 [Microctonus aethiopoides]